MAVIEAGSGGLRIALEDQEAGLLRHLLHEMRVLLEADVPRSDPVVSRIFPDGYDDPSDAEAFHDLVQEELRSEKLAALEQVEAVLGDDGAADVSLDSDLTELWLTVVNDLRLAIGTRLEVTEEKMAAEIDEDHPDGPAMWVLHWLGYMQSSILEGIA